MRLEVYIFRCKNTIDFIIISYYVEIISSGKLAGQNPKSWIIKLDNSLNFFLKYKYIYNFLEILIFKSLILLVFILKNNQVYIFY